MAIAEAEVQQSGRSIGRLGYRGAHDPYARYAPGDVVLDSGVPYLNTAAVGSAPAVVDTFARREGTRVATWDQTTDGSLWVPTEDEPTGVAVRIRQGRGQFIQTDGGGSGQQHMRAGRALATQLREVLVAARLEGDGAPGNLTLKVLLACNADISAATRLNLYRSDETELSVTLQQVGSEASPTTEVVAFTYHLGDTVWVRVRSDGTNVKARVWQPGTPEPAAWLVTASFDADAWAAYVGLGTSTSADGDSGSFSALGVRVPTSLSAPSADAEHWALLADALPAPAPI